MGAPAAWSWLLALLLLVGLALRLAIIASPLGEIDADEAVVGLMARHIAFLAERPVFYYGQPYIGSLEAFSAAPLFRLLDSSTPLLKLVPTAYSLGFAALSALVARRLFGRGPALATAAYLALPPAMWAVWSTKARGGYAEVLFLGEALLLVTLLALDRPSRRVALLWGLLAGLAVWTHPLAAVYLAPCVVFILLQRRGWSGPLVGTAVVGIILGGLPLWWANLTGGFPTVAALLQPSGLPVDVPAQVVRFFRVGVPVLAGLGQPTTSEVLFDADWPTRPAGAAWVAVALLIVLLAGLLVWLPALRDLLLGRISGRVQAALLLLVALTVPPVVAATRFGFLVAEPRYALPLYSAVPLLVGALWRVRRLGRVRWLVVGAVLAVNVWSLLSTDPRLWRPDDAPDSTASTRAQLVRFLVAQDRHQMYTDYWIGYPIMFETRETVLAYVIAGGFNRDIPPADNVQRTPNPAWVFSDDDLTGDDTEAAFLARLQQLHGQAQRADVAVYRVYTDVTPLTAMRPGP